MIDRINLLPSQQRTRAAAGPEVGWFLLVLGLVAAVVAVSGGWEFAQRGALEKRRNEMVSERDRLTVEQQAASAVVGRLQALTAEQAALQARLDTLAALQQGRRSWSELLVRVGRIIPDGLWLTALESVPPGAGAQTPLVLRFQGKALTHARLSELIGTLERDQEFQGVELASTAKGTYLDREVVDFDISFEVGAVR